MIYVIVGPTGSGKSDLAHLLAAIFNAPIINGDAFQIYKDMNIGTNKVSNKDPIYSRYHMLDIISPDQTFSVKQYQEAARKELDTLLKNNEDVIIVGGTGLYIKALLYDYDFSNEENSIDEDLNSLSNHELFLLLEKLDKKESEKIHENNRKRLLRAISMIRHNGKSKTSIIESQKHSLIYKDVKIIYLKPDRNLLYENINSRVEKMFASGLIEEVKSLLNQYDLSITAKAGIGYKEVISYLNNEITYEECVALIQKRTRNYAKRQETFFSHQFSNLNIFASYKEALDTLLK